MVSPVIESFGINVQGSGNTQITIPAPTGIVDGDLLFLSVTVDGNNNAITLPAGFTQIFEQNTGGLSSRLAFKVASSESGDYTVTWVNTERSIGAVLRISGVDTGDPYELGTGDSDNNTLATVLSMTPTNDDVLMLACYFIDGNNLNNDDQSDGGVGWTTLYIRQTDVGGTPSNVTNGISEKNIGASTASLDATQNLVSNDAWRTVQVAINSPAVVAGFSHSQGMIIG